MSNTRYKGIGERFELKGLIYEVEESGIGCEGCSFFYKDECECTLSIKESNEVGYCASARRPDGKDVIFKYIGEVP